MDYTIRVDVSDTVRDFDRAAREAPMIVAATTQRNGNRLLTNVQRLSPFRTGEYRNSHRIELTSTRYTFQAEVGSDLERGEILEFGGLVTLWNGGIQDRPPHPHFRPAFEVVSEEYVDELYRYLVP